MRLKQTVAGVPTTYTQDLAAPLPVVVQAKTGVTTTRYLYDISTRPLAQYTSDGAEYLLADGLGSVRQIADANGYLILTQDYDPYGSVRNSDGLRGSAYGFTSEERDTSGLVYLRARYMQPTLGMFLSRDPWSGDDLRPGSMNGFNYTEGNPVNRVDPSGLSPQSPNWWEGIQIHFQISRDFEQWGWTQGLAVATNVMIQNASKKGNGNRGFADLVDLTNRQVYEIKPRGRELQAVAEAMWYAHWLNIDPQHAGNPQWTLGSVYLSAEGIVGKPIGMWPGYPNYVVMARRFGIGAVVYWGERNQSQNQPQTRPENAWDTLIKLQVLYEMCQQLGKTEREWLPRFPPEKQPVPADYLLKTLAVTLTNFDAHSP